MHGIIVLRCYLTFLPNTAKSNMTENLTSYSLTQLKQLRVRIEKEIVKQESAGKASVLKKLQKLAKAHGMSLDEVLGGTAQVKPAKAVSKASPAPKAPVPVKYRHPSKQDLAWSGRGHRPQWVEVWLANGGALDALMTTAQKYEKKLQRKADATAKSASEVIAAVPQDSGQAEAPATTE